jgi:TRAP transporter TAXI family solute receptor
MLAGLWALAAYILARPTELTIAVSRMSQLDRRAVGALADMLRNEAASIRLTIRDVDSSSAAAAALDSGAVHLAVVRSDVAVPTRAQSVAILRREAALLVAPKRSRIERVADLAGRHVAVVRNTQANVALLHALLDHNAVAHDKVRVTPMEYADVVAALKSRKVDAAMLVGGVGSRQLTEAVRALPRDGQDAPVFVSVDDASGISTRNPQIEAMDVAKGVFGGAPPKPPEEMTTVGFLVRLVARNDIDDNVISAFTRQLLARRTALSAQAPGVGLIEVPDAESAGAVAIHPGVRAHLDGTERTFFERHGDMIYIVMTVLGFVGSIGVAIYTMLEARRNGLETQDLGEGLTLLARIDAAATAAELDAAAADVELFVQGALKAAIDGKLDESDMSAAGLLIERLEARVERRRGRVTA